MKMNSILWLISLLIFSFNGESSAFRKKVCVIGAGPSGLGSLNQLASRIDKFEPIVFEKNSNVGGLWIYTENGTTDEHGLPVHSSVYRNLRTNAPKEIMAYPEYRNFHGVNHSYVPHQTVLEYLRNYTIHFNLHQYIQFDTLVEKVRPSAKSHDGQTTQWQVQTRNLNTNTTSVTNCGAIMICNGNLFQPTIPKVEGIDNFVGKVVHSHSYRLPEVFADQMVVVLGAGTSGLDISRDVSRHAKMVYLSHRHAKIVGLPDNITQVPGVVAAKEKELILSDGSSISADVLIYCTGYEYTYPFLDSSSGIGIENGKFVHPLYKHLINIIHPSMAFIGIPSVTTGFSISSVQAKYFIASLEGKMKLPSYETMLKEVESPSKKSKSKSHVLGLSQWAYYTDLANEAGFEPLPKFYEQVARAFIKFWKTHRLNFQDYDLQFLNNDDITFVDA